MHHLQGPLAQISAQYQSLIVKAEQYYCDAFKIPDEQRARYTGRGRPLRTRILPLGEPVLKETLYSHPLANTFESLSHRLKEIALTLHPRRRGGITPKATRETLIQHVRTHLPTFPWQPCFGSQQEYEALQREAKGMNVDTQAQPLLQMSAKARTIGRKIARRLTHPSKYKFGKWLEDALYNGAGPAHALTKEADTLTPQLEVRINGTPTSNPVSAMDHRADEWGKIWITHEAEWNHLRRVYLQAREAALRHPYLPNYDAQDIKRVIHATNVAKGYGADQVSAGFLRYLPPHAYEEIQELFYAMDRLILPPPADDANHHSPHREARWRRAAYRLIKFPL